MLAQVDALTFRLRVTLWSRLTLRGAFNWAEYERRLQEESEYRRFANWAEARHSLGWSGLAADGTRWLFGVAGYWVPLYGASTMRHELFHAAQDLVSGLFTSEPGLLWSLLAEVSAHVWGGPLAATLALSVILALGWAAYWVASLALTLV